MKILVTGSAGFIGYHLSRKLLGQGFKVVGIDNLNQYYDSSLKHARLEELEEYVRHNKKNNDYEFIKCDISSQNNIKKIFDNNNFDIVINLAAQAGVRYSLENPHAYIDSNILGFVNILEQIKLNPVKHFIFASSSSVYGVNSKQPFTTSDFTDHPISLYAASKKSNELIAHSYSYLYDIPTTGLRFFTVYGPYGRPDMAYYKFTDAIFKKKTIDVYNNGEMLRDFTYIDDIVEGINRLLQKEPPQMKSNSSHSNARFNIYNIGNNNPVSLDKFISCIEDACGIKANKNFLPMQPGDVPITYADIDDLISDIDFHPSTSIKKGIINFVSWYRTFNDI
tara:strand:+ start:407 stop:1417 length:1011 start_codon:yes stop_codon:yes gene_type:complete